MYRAPLSTSHLHSDFGDRLFSGPGHLLGSTFPRLPDGYVHLGRCRPGPGPPPLFDLGHLDAYVPHLRRRKRSYGFCCIICEGSF